MKIILRLFFTAICLDYSVASAFAETERITVTAPKPKDPYVNISDISYELTQEEEAAYSAQWEEKNAHYESSASQKPKVDEKEQCEQDATAWYQSCKKQFRKEWQTHAAGCVVGILPLAMAACEAVIYDDYQNNLDLCERSFEHRKNSCD